MRYAICVSALCSLPAVFLRTRQVPKLSAATQDVDCYFHLDEVMISRISDLSSERSKLFYRLL